MTRTPTVFVDTETDGVHDGRRAWEVALIRREPTGEQTEYQAFLPITLDTADPIGLAKGGFYQRHPLGRWIAGLDGRSHPPSTWELPDYRDPREVVLELARATHGAHWVGLVPDFDTTVIARMLRAHGLTPGWHHHLIDVEALAVGWLKGRAAGLRMAGAETAGAAIEAAILAADQTDLPWRSDDLSRTCGVLPPGDLERHTALGDTRWAARWFDRVTDTAPAEAWAA